MIETKPSEYVYMPESGERWDTGRRYLGSGHPPRTRRINLLAGEKDVGELIDYGTHWSLTYDRCGHSQDFARIGLSDFGCAVREVKHHYAQCLSCRSARVVRLAVPVGVAAQELLWSAADQIEVPLE